MFFFFCSRTYISCLAIFASVFLYTFIWFLHLLTLLIVSAIARRIKDSHFDVLRPESIRLSVGVRCDVLQTVPVMHGWLAKVTRR